MSAPMTTAPRIPDDIARTVVDPKAHADPLRLDAAFAWLRANMPLGVADIEGCDPFWVVTKHADILEVSRQNALFTNGVRATTFTTKELLAQVYKITGTPHLVKSLVQMDPPEHTDYRLLTQAWFMPQNLKRLEDRVRAIAREHADLMAAKAPECDFVDEVAVWYPLRVVMEILGVPREDEPRMLKLTQELFGATDEDLGRGGARDALASDEGVAVLQSVVMDFFQYFNAITEDRRKNPRDDLASVIANGAINGQPLDPFNAMSYYVIVATAGHDTTSSSTAGGLWALLDNPDQLARLKADPSLIPGFVDESIRWTTPVRHFMRSPREDYVLRGQQLKAGDWMMLCYPSGNRDEDVFEAPDRFDITRSPNKHLAFGYGAHLCLGQHLAKLEMKMLWEEIIPRLSHIEHAGPARLSAANFVNGPKKLPIRFTMS
jgi:cytochrome P450